MALLTKTLLLTYQRTGDEKYLRPIRSMAEIRMKYLGGKAPSDAEPGTAAWCALEGAPRFGGGGMDPFLPGTLAKYRLLTGDERYDRCLRQRGGGYMRMRLGEGREALVAALEENAKAFRINRPAYTDEMRWTDRILTFNERWGNEANGWGWPAPCPRILYAAATGDPGSPFYFPLAAVRWMTEPRKFAALVTDSGRERFQAELYHFGERPRRLGATLLLLQPGDYAWALKEKAGDRLRGGTLEGEGPRTRLDLKLPPRTLCHLRITPAPSE